MALDADTKLTPCYYIATPEGRRQGVYERFASRLTNRVQITSDALKSRIDAVEVAFGADVDFGQSVKFE